MPDFLLCDDDPDIRELVGLALDGAPQVRLTACDTGAAAIAHCTGARPDLVILDVNLPDMTGPEVLARLRAILPDPPPVVFLTADTAPRDVDRLRTLGAAAVLAKPFRARDLAADLLALL